MGLATCSLFGYISRPFVITFLIISLGGRKKRKNKRKEWKKIRPPHDFKPIEQVLLVFLDDTRRRELGFTLLLCYGFARIGTRCGLQYSQLTSFWPRSSVYCQAQISLSVSASTAWVNLRHEVPLTHWASGHTVWDKLGCVVPFRVRAAQITLRESQPFFKSSLPSSCPPFLTRTWIFTQTNFPTTLENIRVTVWHGPTPPFPRWNLAPQCLWCWSPESQWMYIASVCLQLQLYSPQWLPASRSLLVPGFPLCSGRGESWWSNSPPCILQQVLGRGPQQPRSLSRSQRPYCTSTISSPTVFQCPLQFLASKLLIS